MAKVSSKFIIPACEGRAFTVRKGQTLRIIAVEGPQAADMIAFNLHDMKESLSTWLSAHINRCLTRVKKLYSKLPAGNIMFTVLTEKDGIFWVTPGRCNRFTYELHYGVKGYHKNCQDILAECIKPYGMTSYDVPDVINIFMKAVYRQDGSFELEPSPVGNGDYVELLAEMDCLVAISACPDEFGAYNEFKTKPIGIQILG